MEASFFLLKSFFAFFLRPSLNGNRDIRRKKKNYFFLPRGNGQKAQSAPILRRQKVPKKAEKGRKPPFFAEKGRFFRVKNRDIRRKKKKSKVFPS